jgi:hypothetical protein
MHFLKTLPWIFGVIGLGSIVGLILALMLKIRVYDSFGVSKGPIITVSIWETLRDSILEKLGLKEPSGISSALASLVKIKVGF